MNEIHFSVLNVVSVVITEATCVAFISTKMIVKNNVLCIQVDLQWLRGRPYIMLKCLSVSNELLIKLSSVVIVLDLS